MKRAIYCVQWVGMAPLSHAGFTRAYEVLPTVYRLEFPIENTSLRHSRQAQYQWAQEVVRHLASWQVKGQIMEMPEKPERPSVTWTGYDERWAGQCADAIVSKWCEDETIEVRALAERWTRQTGQFQNGKTNMVVDRIMGKVTKLLAVLAKV